MNQVNPEDIELPENYVLQARFEEQVTVGMQRIYLSGLALRGSEGRTIATGAAASNLGGARRRAWWTLLEKVAIAESDSGSARDRSSERRSLLRSNGVAIKGTERQAMDKARAELLGRHHVLKHWLSGAVPQRLAWTSPPIQDYGVRAYAFHESPWVVGYIAIPILEGLPMGIGVGCHPHIDVARGKASQRLAQRLGFLMGAKLPDEDPEIDPSGWFHREFYVCPKNQKRVLAWLNGEFEGLGLDLVPTPFDESDSAIHYENITPDFFGRRAVVIRATSEQHIPLLFGDYPGWSRYLPLELQAHPSA